MATVRVIVQGIFMGQACWTVLHGNVPDYVTANLATIAADFRDNYCNTYVKPRLPSEFTFTNINVQPVHGSTDSALNLAISIQGTSGSGSNMLPTTCCVLRLFTGFAGRHGRGRIYLPGLGPACLSFGQIASGCLTVYQTTCDQILARYGSSGPSIFDLVIANRADLSDLKPVLAMSPRVIPGVQRRRSIGVGI
jgi:hypothetical protein